MKNFFFTPVIICMTFTACSDSTKEQFGEIDTQGYEVEIISVDYREQTQLHDTTEYEIAECIPLQLPPAIPAMYATFIRRNKDRIYVLDKKINKSVLVFNDKGEYLYKLGNIGHAKNEYIKCPTCLSINYTNDEVSVYEQDSWRVLIFGGDGEFRRSFMFQNYVPMRLNVTSTGNYLCAIHSRLQGSDYKLALYDSNGEFIKGYFPMGTEERLGIWGCLYSCNDVVCYNPMMTDLAVLFKDDEIQKFIKVDFGGAFTKTKKIHEAHTAIYAGQRIGSFDPIFENEKVNLIDHAEQSESLFHVRYTVEHGKHHNDYFLNRKTGKYLNFRDGKILDGIWPSQRLWIHEDQIITLFDEDDVIKARAQYHRDSANGPALYARTHPRIQKIIDGEIKTPAFVSIKLKL